MVGGKDSQNIDVLTMSSCSPTTLFYMQSRYFRT